MEDEMKKEKKTVVGYMVAGYTAKKGNKRITMFFLKQRNALQYAKKLSNESDYESDFGKVRVHQLGKVKKIGL